MISLLLFDNFYAVTSYRHEFKRKRKRRIIVYGSVTRHGPQSVASAVVKLFSCGSNVNTRSGGLLHDKKKNEEGGFWGRSGGWLVRAGKLNSTAAPPRESAA